MNKVSSFFSFSQRVIVGFLLVAVGLSFTFFDNVKAENNGQAFSISPPLIELNADPGQTVEAKIKLTNVSSGSLLVSTQKNDFGAKDETGEPNILFDEDELTPYSLQQWITAPGDFTLESKGTRELTIPITVPKNAEPGGHYAVVRFTGSATEGNQNVSLSASIGSLVLLKVAGDIKEDAKIEDFYPASPQFEKKSFFETGPVTFAARIKNEGNIHIKPTGVVEVTDTFGKQVASMRINGDPSDKKNLPKNILPQSVRRFNVSLENTKLFGRYTATLRMEYGEGKSLEQQTTFWVIPYRIIIIVVIALVILTFAIIRGIKQYNAHIIKRAAQNNRKNDQ